MDTLETILQIVNNEIVDAYHMTSVTEAEDVLPADEFEEMAQEIEKYVAEEIAAMSQVELLDALQHSPAVWQAVLDESVLDMERFRTYFTVRDVDDVLRAALIRTVLADLIGVNPY